MLYVYTYCTVFYVAAGTTCNVVPASSRINCGKQGITRKACYRKGCCWDTGVRDVPWCFLRAPLSTTASTTELVTTTTLSQPNCDIGYLSDRRDCGFPRVNKRTCREKGCCWDSSVLGVPWCFHGLEPEPNCDVGYRVDCGFPGVTESTCLEKGCCWDSSVLGLPWCFHGVDRPTTTPVVTTHEPEPKCDVVRPSERVDCGYPGIHPDACRKLKCCWNETILGFPWCFYGTDITSTTATTVTQPPIAHCDVPSKSRKRCGQRGVSSKRCIKKGCCWKPSKLYSVPSCYYAASKPGPSGCDPKMPNRMTCGYIGISKVQCSEKGCCWDDSVPGRPKCYRPNTGQCCCLRGTSYNLQVLVLVLVFLVLVFGP